MVDKKAEEVGQILKNSYRCQMSHEAKTRASQMSIKHDHIRSVLLDSMFHVCHLNTGRNYLSVSKRIAYVCMSVLHHLADTLFAVYRWVSGPVWLWSPSCLHPAATAALQPGQDCFDTHHHEQLQLHLEEVTEDVLVTVCSWNYLPSKN